MIRILLLVLLAVITASSQPGGLDPRCEEHQCAVVEPYPQDFLADPTACGYGECPKCLVGPEWEARLAELGVGAAKRSFVPTIIFDNWLTATISETIFRILAEETMQYTTDPAPLYPTGFDVLCCNKDIVALEKWPSVPMPDDEGYFSLTQIPIGYEGGSGLFVPKHTVDAYPLATSYNAYKYLPEYQSIFPKGYSTPCIDASVNKSLGCTAGNYFCDEETWTNTTCAAQGRYVPPQCEADPTSCQEIYFALPSFDVAFFEALIKNTGLKFIAVYLGAGGMPERVIADVKAGKHIMFYWYVPDSLVELVKGQPVVFPPPTLACRQGQRTDPTLSKGDCDYGKASLMKLARRSSLAKDGDFKFFFESFQISATQMGQMLGQHTSAGGTLPVYNVSCNWIRENYGTWKDWVRNTPPPSAGNATSGGDSAGRTTLIAAVASVGGAAVLIGVCAIVVVQARARKALKHAPRKAPMAIVFTDVESSTTLWERYGSKMGAAIELHNALIRECIEEYHCYEVKQVGDSVIMASVSLVDAAMCCLAIQTRLMEAKWPEALKYWKEGSGDAADAGLFCGLRVRMGLHYAREIDPKMDALYKRMDYFGPDMNLAARVESAAQGGQILMTADTYRALVGDADFATLIGEDAAITKFCSGLELKGVAEPATLYSMVPVSLAGRYFEPIAGAIDEVAPAVMSNSDTLSFSHSSVASRGGSKSIARVLKHVVDQLPSRKEQDLLLSTLLSARGGNAHKGASIERRVKTLAVIYEAELGVRSGMAGVPGVSSARVDREVDLDAEVPDFVDGSRLSFLSGSVGRRAADVPLPGSVDE